MVSNLRNRWKRISESWLGAKIAMLVEWRLQHPYLFAVLCQQYKRTAMLSALCFILHWVTWKAESDLDALEIQAADDEIPFDFIPSPHNKACLGLYFP
jgi:hypothetical protein